METPVPALVRRWVELYRSHGLQCLPSDPRTHDAGGRKRPLVRYSHLWEQWSDEDLFARFPACNVQVMLGRSWGVCVLDLDGPGALALPLPGGAWPRLPRTWVSSNSRATHSRHVWFKTPAGTAPRPKRVLWRGDGEHSAAELLCDRSLIMAPPSLHPKTRRQYHFLRGRSPLDCPLAPCPGWLWTMPAAATLQSQLAFEPLPAHAAPPPSAPRGPRPGRVPDWRAVLAAVPVEQVARSWGLRFARGRPSAEGWHPVHDYDREDAHPSAAFNVVTGRFWRPGIGKTISLFELGVGMGHYADWRECCTTLGGFYGVIPGATR